MLVVELDGKPSLGRLLPDVEVQQLSATAEELSAQAAQLQDLMSHFELVDDHQRKPAVAANRARPDRGAPALRFGQARGEAAFHP